VCCEEDLIATVGLATAHGKILHKWETDLRNEIPNYDDLAGEATKVLGLTDAGKPLRLGTWRSVSQVLPFHSFRRL
jgi:hypothetical protein